MSSGRSRQTKKTLGGWLTSRLVSDDVMGRALNMLLEGTRRYTFVIKRPRINWETREVQERFLVLRESDSVDLEPDLDRRLLRAREVRIFVELEDDGVAEIDLTLRSWVKWAESPNLREKMVEFNRSLIQGARTWWLSLNGAGAMVGLPILFLVVIWGSYVQLDSDARNALSNNQTIPDPPSWIATLLLATFVVWIVATAAALIIFLMILSSGGLRTWPKYLTLKDLAQTLFRVRDAIALPNIVNTVIAGAVVAGISSLLTVLFVK
jgi:hypothetical protein